MVAVAHPLLGLVVGPAVLAELGVDREAEQHRGLRRAALDGQALAQRAHRVELRDEAAGAGAVALALRHRLGGGRLNSRGRGERPDRVAGPLLDLARQPRGHAIATCGSSASRSSALSAGTSASSSMKSTSAMTSAPLEPQDA